jgi:hypothetical protein
LPNSTQSAHTRGTTPVSLSIGVGSVILECSFHTLPNQSADQPWFLNIISVPRGDFATDGFHQCTNFLGVFGRGRSLEVALERVDGLAQAIALRVE